MPEFKPLFNWTAKAIIPWVLVASIIADAVIFEFINLLAPIDIQLKKLSTAFIVYSATLSILFLIIRNRNISFYKLGLHFRGSWKDWSFCLILGTVLNFLFYRLQLDILGYTTQAPTGLLKTHGFILLCADIVIIGLIGPVMEEILFRAILLRTLINQTSVFLAIIITTGVFALGHIGDIQSLLHLISITVTGLLLCIIYAKTRILINTFIFHASWNITAILQTYISYNWN